MAGRYAILTFAAILFLFSIDSYAGGLTRDNNETLKNETREELRSEIRSIVKEEIENYFREGRFSKAKEGPAPGQKKGIEELVRSELDSYVASGIEQEMETSAGMMKTRSEEGVKSGSPEESPEDVIAGKESAIEAKLVQKGSMLLPKGKLQVEPSFTFAHFSSNRINIEGFAIVPILVIGEVSTESVKRDILIQTMSFKYGLPNNMQADISIPHRYEYDRVTNNNLGSTSESMRNEAGFGDVVLALSRQVAYDNGMIPDTVASLSVKPPTGKSSYNRDIGLGTGHWAVKGNMIFAKSNDPAVVFGSIGYTYNFQDTINDFGKVKPGDTIGYSVGAAIALSYQTAINFQLVHDVTFKMRKDDASVSGSFMNSASLKNGFTWSISERSSVDFSVSKGLTTDAPDYSIEIRFPHYF